MTKPWKTTATVNGFPVREVDEHGNVSMRRPRFEVRVAITIDWNGIARMLAQRAFDNRSRTARALSGLIVCKIVEGGRG